MKIDERILALCKELPDNFYEGLPKINALAEFNGANKKDHYLKENYDLYIQLFGLLQIYAETHKVTIEWPIFDKGELDTVKGIISFIKNLSLNLKPIRDKHIIDSTKNELLNILGGGFSYKITEGDVNRIQALINELRDLIQQSKEVGEEHKNRLLKKLEKLQLELHKKISSLDSFWGLIGDAGTLVYKLGNDAKPIVDRIREIVDIIWRVQSIAEELPSGKPRILLEPRREEDIKKNTENLA